MKKLSPRPLQLWFLNRALDADEVVFQVREMKRQGFGGFFMHYLGGEPYLGETWFQLLDRAIAEAARQNLEAWLYDECWCPSFFAGGRILTRRPELELKSLWRYFREVPGGAAVDIAFEPMKVLLAKAVPVRGGRADMTQAVDLTAQLGTIAADEGVPFIQNESYYPHVAPVPHWRARVNKRRYWQLKWRAPRGSAWRIFIFCERRRFEFDGNNLLDVLNPGSIVEFIRETHEKYRQRYRHFFGNVIPGIMTDEPKFTSFPYTPALPRLYEQRYAEDFSSVMPALLDASMEEHERTLARYHRLVSDLFQQNYIRPMAEWCRRNGLLLTGHLSPEECPWQEVELLGNLAGCLRHFDIPGTDIIIQAIGDKRRKALNLGPRVAASVARQQGKSLAFVEVGACCREDLSLEQLKLICDWLMLNGINLITFHGLMYSMEGFRKFLTSQNLSVYNNLWCNFKLLNDYLAERCRLLREYRPAPEIAVLKPLHALRTLTLSINRVVAGSDLSTGAAGLRGTDDCFTKERGKIDQSLIDLCWSLLTAHVGFDLLDDDGAATWKIGDQILAFNHARYRAVIVPACDELSPECARALARFAARGGLVLFDRKLPGAGHAGSFGQDAAVKNHSELISRIRQRIPDDFSISGAGADDVFCCQAENRHGKRIVFLLNIAGAARRVDLAFQGRQQSIALVPYESRIIRLKPSAFAVPTLPAAPAKSIALEFNKAWRVSVENDNHVPLRSRENLVSLADKMRGLYLVCDESELDLVKAGLEINGQGFAQAIARVSRVKFYDAYNLRLDLVDGLRKGENRLTLKTGSASFPTLLLAGRFAAFACKPVAGYRIEKEPQRCESVSRVKCGYPFLRGAIEFCNEFKLAANLSAGARLELPGRSGSLLVIIDHHVVGSAAWQPDSLMLPFLRRGRHRLILRVVGDSLGLLRGPACEAGIASHPVVRFT